MRNPLFAKTQFGACIAIGRLETVLSKAGKKDCPQLWSSILHFMS